MMSRRLILLLLACSPVLLFAKDAQGELFVVNDAIAPLPITAHTGMKPQSKLWELDGRWWGCFTDSSGTYIWGLTESRWIRALKLSTHTDVRADVLSSGTSVEILLFRGVHSSLIRAAYFDDAGEYRPIGLEIPVTLDEGVETATIARSESDLWIASDGVSEINVRWLGPTDSSFSDPITLYDGVSKDDICVITSLRDGSVGVLWSNQNAQRYGFRRHVGPSEPHQWFPDEVPAGSSAIDHGEGMSDDHLNVAIAKDGTLYATVKTSYDTHGMPLVACLVRRPHGRWDPLYHVDDEGSRGVMVLDETAGRAHAVYTSYRDSTIVVRSSATDSIAYSDRTVLITKPRINNVSVPRNSVSGVFPIVASQGDSLMHTVLVKTK